MSLQPRQPKSPKKYRLNKEIFQDPIKVKEENPGVSLKTEDGKKKKEFTIDKMVAIASLIVFSIIFYVFFEHLPEIIEIVKAITVSAKHV